MLLIHFWNHFLGLVGILHLLLLPTSIWLKQVNSSVYTFSAGSNLVSFPFDIMSSYSASFLLTLTYYYHILAVWGLVFGDDLDPHPTFTIRVAPMPVILPLSHQGPSGCVGFGLTMPLPCLFYSSPVFPIWFFCDWYFYLCIFWIQLLYYYLWIFPPWSMLIDPVLLSLPFLSLSHRLTTVKSVRDFLSYWMCLIWNCCSSLLPLCPSDLSGNCCEDGYKTSQYGSVRLLI